MKPFGRLGIAALILFGACVGAYAQSSLGIGNNEVSTPPTGVFAGFFNWINTHQREFYRAMTDALRAMRDDGAMPWLLIGLSFAYGVLHAAGPGHGKAIISSYMLANETTLKRGIVLSFVSSFLQAASALLIIGIAFLALRGTTYKMSDATQVFEVASFAAITAFGAWLLWRKIFRSGHAHSHDHHHDHDHAHTHKAHDHHGHDHHKHDHAHQPHAHSHGHAHGKDEVCETCGHSHAPDPQLIATDFSWKTATSAVLAVGLRPCTGALIVLTFALLNGLYVGGILSVLAMALGTAITVSALATLAVSAKNLALKYSSATSSDRLLRGIEIGGAALVFAMGLSLLGASLSA
ncbi:MAG: nickel/cobalt transporter [Rhizobiaceae bacterium]